MISLPNRLRFLRSSGLFILPIVLLVACGADQSPQAANAEHQIAPAEVSAAPVVEPVVEQTRAGSVDFAVDGIEKHLEYLPASGSYYYSVGSQLRAYSAAGSTESVYISFFSMDLRKLTYPVELPLPKDPSNKDPMAAGASVAFGYVNDEGVEWAGLGQIQVESFGADGVIRGTFDQVSLRHTYRELPNVMLTGGSFTARIGNQARAGE